MSYKRFLKSFAIVLVLAVVTAAQDLASFEKRITVKTLDNGLTVIICERPEAPVFSFFTHVDAGSVQDPLGQTGLAHMFEHMAFKGTDKIGTTDYAAEKVALEKVEQVYAAYIAERDKPVGRDEQKLKELQKAWQDAIAEANKYVKPNEFPQIVENNGGEDLNAYTADDETELLIRSPKTGWSCGPISSRNASCTRSCASFTRNATSSSKSDACASTVSPSAACWNNSPPRLFRP